MAEDEDAWEKFDGPLNTVLQKTPEEMRLLVHVGEYGLHGLHRFLAYIDCNYGITAPLIELKLERLMNAMNEV